MGISGSSSHDISAELLAQQMLRLARRRRDIQGQLFDRGYAKCSQLFQEQVREQAQTSEDRQNLEQYYDEYAAERLGALAGPVDIERGRFPAVHAYRSSFLDILREQAAPRLVPGNYFILDPTIVRFLDARRHSRQEATAFLDKYAERVAAEHYQRHPEAIGYIGPLSREKLVQDLMNELGPGYRVKTQRAKFCAIGRNLDQAPVTFGLSIEAPDSVENGIIQPVFSVWSVEDFAKTKIGPLSHLASLLPGALVPFYQITNLFDRNDWNSYSYSLSSLAFLTNIIHEQLQDIFRYLPE